MQRLLTRKHLAADVDVPLVRACVCGVCDEACAGAGADCERASADQQHHGTTPTPDLSHTPDTRGYSKLAGTTSCASGGGCGRAGSRGPGASCRGRRRPQTQTPATSSGPQTKSTWKSYPPACNAPTCRPLGRSSLSPVVQLVHAYLSPAATSSALGFTLGPSRPSLFAPPHPLARSTHDSGISFVTRVL